MYKEFYGFREKPFNIVPDPSFLYLSAKHKLALSYLEYGIMDGINFILITGEIGAGKTTIIKQLLEQIGDNLDIATVFNTNVSSEQLLELILTDFEVDISVRSKVSYLEALNQFLIKKYAQGQRALLIIDEAQNLSQEALEEVRMISNLQTGKDPLIQIVLVGQPNLRDRLRQPSLAQFCQRIAVSYHLAPLSSEETDEYISHRLKKAGLNSDEKPFTQEAVKKIFNYSAGIPRTINILCDAALLYGYADELKSIEVRVIEHVVKDKQELGVFNPYTIEQEAQCTDSQNNNDLLHRIESVEKKLNKLSGIVDWYVQRNEQKTESYKDNLIQKLEKMLAKEQKQNESLLLKNMILRNELKMEKVKAEKDMKK